MRRISAAIAAGVTVSALFLAGCGDDAETTAAPASTNAAAPSAANSQGAENAKAGIFLVSFTSAFPKLTEGKDKSTLTGYFTDTCADVKDGKSDDAITAGISTRTGASADEAPAIYQMAKMLC